MALSHALRLYASVNVQRQLLARSQPVGLGGLRWCSEGRKEMIPTPRQQEGGSGSQGTARPGFNDHRINRLERYLLVWGGKYKTLAEVPDLVSRDTLERAKNKARIKINLMMCAATLIACLAMVYSGKRARDAGESVVKINQDWHKQVNEEHRRSEEKKNE